MARGLLRHTPALQHPLRRVRETERQRDRERERERERESERERERTREDVPARTVVGLAFGPGGSPPNP